MNHHTSDQCRLAFCESRAGSNLLVKDFRSSWKGTDEHSCSLAGMEFFALVFGAEILSLIVVVLCGRHSFYQEKMSQWLELQWQVQEVLQRQNWSDYKIVCIHPDKILVQLNVCVNLLYYLWHIGGGSFVLKENSQEVYLHVRLT